MAETDAGNEETEPAASHRRRWPWVLGALAVLLAVVLAWAWLSRERIAHDLITDQLRELGLPGTYRIDTISTGDQVLRDVVLGDPARPDATVEEVRIAITPRFGLPSLQRIVLVRPRLYGSWRSGRFSFGSLDKVLFAGTADTPFRLPDLDIEVQDGRALLETDHGPVGMKLSGSGVLRDGFAGELAAVAPGLTHRDCRAQRVSLYGKLSVDAEQPRFAGPLRLADLGCQALRAADVVIQLDSTLGQALDEVQGSLDVRSGALSVGSNRLRSAQGRADFGWRKQALTARYDLTGAALATPQAALEKVRIAGALRGLDGFARFDGEGTLEGEGLRPGPGIDAAMAGLVRAGQGTMLAPIAAQIRAALSREAAGSRFGSEFTFRRNGDLLSVNVPRGELRGGSGDVLLALSRLNISQEPGGTPRIAGNFMTGGTGLPEVSGRMERGPDRKLTMRLAMAEYRAGSARLAMPRLLLSQARNGALGFAGEARVSGDFPGGRADGLVVPLDGNWSTAGGLALWRGCTPLAFERLKLGELTLDSKRLTLCPPKGSAIVRSDMRGLRLAAGAAGLGLTGRLGTTPMRLTSGPLGFAAPGSLQSRSLDVWLGQGSAASRFRVSGLSARIDKDLSGRFTGTDVTLAAVPLDLSNASGAWRFSGGRLTIDGAAFRLEDRVTDDRFQPLVAQDANLTLADGKIVANAILREPVTQREVLRTVIRHDLARATGNADLFVDALRFDKELQPDELTRQALGVIANADGTVRGTGRIDWTANGVASSGTFSTENFDLAAALGPVKGVTGTIRFTDLLGMVTAPDQIVKIASLNPGIEVRDGEMVYELQPNSRLVIKGGYWPFMGGSLLLQPTQLNFGVAETRRYTMVIDRADAARLVQQMELGNLAVTGIFDGTLPLVFDEEGGHIRGGLLQSRAPGGSVAYVGELTYKDLSPMANFAFDALKALDYRSMRIEMDGSLAGEIVTKVNFDGIRQGQSARRNFITRQIARLPIRFNVNIRAPFFQLATSLRAIYDPAYIRDPRSVGLLDAEGRPLATPKPTAPGIQPPESGDTP